MSRTLSEAEIRLDEALWWHTRFAAEERYGCCKRIAGFREAARQNAHPPSPDVAGALLEKFRCDLIDGLVVKESDGDPWPLTKSEANQIVAELEKRLRIPPQPETAQPASTGASLDSFNVPSNPHPEITEAVSKVVTEYGPTLMRLGNEPASTGVSNSGVICGHCNKVIVGSVADHLEECSSRGTSTGGGGELRDILEAHQPRTNGDYSLSCTCGFNEWNFQSWVSHIEAALRSSSSPVAVTDARPSSDRQSDKPPFAETGAPRICSTERGPSILRADRSLRLARRPRGRGSDGKA